MLFIYLLIIIISNIYCQQDYYQTIPLRYDLALKYVKQYQYSNLNKYVDKISKYTIISENSFSYSKFISNNNLTNQCENDFNLTIQGLLKHDTWALKIFDSWGKPLPSGILVGNIYWIGNYDECLNLLYQPINKTFILQPIQTQYCSVTTKEFIGLNGLVLGLCIPSTCNHQDIVLLIHSIFQESNITENDLVCSNDFPNGQKNLTNGAIITITILSLLGLLVLIGTIIDLINILKSYIKNTKVSYINLNIDEIEERTSLNLLKYSYNSTDELISKKFFIEFSAWKSLKRIFIIKQEKKSNNHELYLFINGIRVLSLFWVIIGHSFLFNLIYTNNPIDAMRWTRNITFQLISSGEFSVDTFFVLSGFLTTILFVRQVEKQGKKISLRLIILYYIHRYIRLTPTFLIIIAISINLTPYFGSGPIYPKQNGFEVSQCREKYWWTSILYIGNIYKSDYVCLPVSWYLYNDMQFHWIAPLVLIPFVMKQKPLAFILTILFIFIGIGSTAGLLIYYPDLQTSSIINQQPVNGRTFSNTIYVTPWCRISAYFIGVLTGFFFINTGRLYRINKYILIIFSILSILFGLICIFGFYPDYILESGMNRILFIFYQSLSRTLWSLSISWLIYLCMINRCKIINNILSWSIWIPLSKLNYSTYLIHLTIIFIMITNQRYPFYYQIHLVINNFFIQIFFSYLTAILIVIFIETPFFLIEKKLFKR